MGLMAAPTQIFFERIGVRLTKQELALCRKLGQGNISNGIRFALRYCSDKPIKPVPLSMQLRSMAELVRQFEEDLHARR